MIRRLILASTAAMAICVSPTVTALALTADEPTPQPKVKATQLPSTAPTPVNPGPKPKKAGSIDSLASVQGFHLVPAGSNGVDPASIPRIKDVFVTEEVAQILPGLKKITYNNCEINAKQHTSTCVIDLELSGENPQHPSRLVVRIGPFGQGNQAVSAWNKQVEANTKRSEQRAGLYTFYTPGSYGVAGAFSDGTTTHVLLRKGNIVGQIWFSGIGFTALKDNYLESRRSYREDIAPALITLLSSKMAANQPPRAE